MLFGSISIVIVSFILSFYLLPALIKIANRFNLYDTPSLIKQHGRKVPYLGGVALILSMLITISLFLPESIEKPKYINSYLILMTLIFLHGLDDDFFNHAPGRKFIVQAILCSILIYKTGFYLPLETMFSNLYIPKMLSYFITLLAAMAIVNAYNLIDGADGLAASISLIASLFYAGCFYLDSNFFFFFMALSVAGALMAFLLYNKPPAHIFMGDSGSLFIGMLLATFTLVFIETKPGTLDYNVSNRIILSFSFVSIPILDMIRLFVVRIYEKRSPFKGDNNHIHHLMAKIGFTGNQTILIIVTFQLLNVGIAFLALNKSWIGFILINVCSYTFLIQFLRQLNTFLAKRNIQGIGVSDAETASAKEKEGA